MEPAGVSGRPANFGSTSGGRGLEWTAMSEKKSFSVVSLIIDLVLVAIAFVIFYSLVHSHVPSTDPKMITLWGGLTAGCMSGVFWLAWNMLKVVFKFQRQSRS